MSDLGCDRQALALDDGAVYNERLQLALHRLQLRAELYQQPNRPEDEAAMIIEQVIIYMSPCIPDTVSHSEVTSCLHPEMVIAYIMMRCTFS